MFIKSLEFYNSNQVHGLLRFGVEVIAQVGERTFPAVVGDIKRTPYGDVIYVTVNGGEELQIDIDEIIAVA